MIWFWIAAALVSAVAATLIVQRAARAAMGVGSENPSLAVYRRQMAELDELAARGVLAEDDRRGVRAEVGRRLLAAANRAEAPRSATRPIMILILAAAAPLVALGVYEAVGSPGLPDQPFARRLAAWSNQPQPLETLSPLQLAELMRAAAAKSPGDPGPLYFLARYELEGGELNEAAQAVDRAIRMAPGRADFWDLKGEIAVTAAQGDMTADARADFQRAVALDSKSPNARFRLALDKIQHGDIKGGVADWKSLVLDLDPADPRRQGLTAAIAQLESGKPLPASPPSAPGPQTPAIGAPQIQGMVDALAAQLKAHPDDPDGWVRLVRAYGVLGETDRRDAALAEARRRFAGRADVLNALARAAGPAS